MTRNDVLKTVVSRTGEGYGSEDIHAKDGIPIDDVRQIVRMMRDTGQLRRMFARPSNQKAPTS